jgi:hypothetical protein
MVTDEVVRETVYTPQTYALRLRVRVERFTPRRTERAVMETIRRLWRRWQRRSGFIYSPPRVRMEEDFCTGQHSLVTWARVIVDPPRDVQERLRLQEWLDRRYGTQSMERGRIPLGGTPG